jgi:ATP-binding cassette subfamily B protein
LDEATSHVDLETDKRMQAIMEDAFSACTVIFVTHRLETVSMADIALEVDEGKIARVRKRDPVSKAWVES